MSAHHFDGSNIADDLADSYYLAIVHNLVAIGELTPAQEAAGGLTIATHGLHLVTQKVEQVPPEKVESTIYFGSVALYE